ncbi:MAG: response regulator [Phototrophicaceae bacterium]
MPNKVLKGFTATVIDDEAHNLQIIRRLLQAVGVEVTAFEGAEEALKSIQHSHPDFVITDVLMPNMDGWGFAQAMRTETSTQHIPIIAFTAMSNFDDLNAVATHPFDVCIKKPIVVAEFIPQFIQIIQSIPSLNAKLQAR